MSTCPMPGDEELEQLRRIDRLCEQIEQGWLRGERPAIEDGLSSSLPEDRPSLLEELLQLEWAYRRGGGEAFGLDEYRNRFSSEAARVERAWGGWSSGDTVDGSYVPETALPNRESTRQAAPGPEPAAALPAGYVDRQPIAEGGMGTVFKALDPRLGRLVALKVLRFPRADLLARFRIEARALARLSHPHIVQVYGLEEHDGEPCLVMEYVAGGTLEERLRTTILSSCDAARLVAVLARAVKAAHDAGIVHRDLKPANVLLAAAVEGGANNVMGFAPKVSDFGLARLADEAGRTGIGQVIGTPHYMSPEQAVGQVERIGPPADVWALGVILYRCLTRQLPFDARSTLETLDKVRREEPPRTFGPGVPAELGTLCLRCLEKEPERRPQVGELAASLERIAAGLSSETTALPEPPPARRPTRTRRRRLAVPIAAALAALLVTVAVVVWATRPGPGDDPEPPKSTAAPRIRVFKVLHWSDQGGGKARFTGEINEQVQFARFEDQVRIEVEFTEPAHAFLIGFNADGKEQLLWPVGPDRTTSDAVAPPRQGKFTFPAIPGKVLNLDDEPAGGLQAFAVVASREPLPPFREWSQQRGPAAWRRLPPGDGVWDGDADAARRRASGVGWLNVRGQVQDEKGRPPLEPLCRSLLREGAELVEAVAFGVRPKQPLADEDD